MASACSKLDQAFAEARSSGMPAEPMRASSRSIHSNVPPSAGWSAISYGEPSSVAVDEVLTSGDRRELPVDLEAGDGREVVVLDGRVKRAERVWTGT